MRLPVILASGEATVNSVRAHPALRSFARTLVAVLLAAALSSSVARTTPWPSASIPNRTLFLQQNPSCTTFDSHIWAQSVFDTDPARHVALDPDGDRFACEELALGAAPALWTDDVPNTAIPMDFASVTDGDTIDVFMNGRLQPVRLVGVDARESGGPYQEDECFGAEGAQFLTWLLGQRGQLFIEKDQEERDRFGRLLRWVWFERADGKVYLLNEAMIRAGYAERFRDTPNRRYVDELIAAEDFAQRHRFGLWSACVGSIARDGMPPTRPANPPDADCDPAYPDVCIPSPPPDLGCRDVPYSRFRVFPPDPHHFDGNLDGIACEGPG